MNIVTLGVPWLVYWESGWGLTWFLVHRNTWQTIKLTMHMNLVYCFSVLNHELCSPWAVQPWQRWRHRELGWAGSREREKARERSGGVPRACAANEGLGGQRQALWTGFPSPSSACTHTERPIPSASFRFPPICPEATCKGKERQAHKVGAWACLAASREVYSVFRGSLQ